ncbi:MAG: DNA-binding protein WhiA [Fusobacteriota bacterium]
MSYTNLVKEEVLQKEANDYRNAIYEMYGILRSKNMFYEDRIEFKNENIGISKRIYSYFKTHSDLKIEIKYVISKNFGAHKEYKIIIKNQNGFKEATDFLRDENISMDKNEFKNYMRGVFLATGYIKNPEKGYALDFFMDNEKEANRLFNTLKKLDKKIHITQKRGKPLVYLRNSEDIMDILIMLGANKAFFEYENTTLMKDIKNKTIRAINWEIANEAKIMKTGHRQVIMINYVDEKVGLESLSDVLQEAAQIRLKYPETSLKELAKKIGLSKSGIRGRFRRIKKLYDELKQNEVDRRNR